MVSSQISFAHPFIRESSEVNREFRRAHPLFVSGEWSEVIFAAHILSFVNRQT